MVTKMMIRQATEEDIDRITEMHQSYIESWHPREYFERLIEVENPLVLVAVLDSKMELCPPRKYGCMPSRAYQRHW